MFFHIVEFEVQINIFRNLNFVFLHSWVCSSNIFSRMAGHPFLWKFKDMGIFTTWMILEVSCCLPLFALQDESQDYIKRQQLRELALLNSNFREESPGPSGSVSPFNSSGMKRAKTGRWNSLINYCCRCSLLSSSTCLNQSSSYKRIG